MNSTILLKKLLKTPETKIILEVKEPAGLFQAATVHTHLTTETAERRYGCVSITKTGEAILGHSIAYKSDWINGDYISLGYKYRLLIYKKGE